MSPINPRPVVLITGAGKRVGAVIAHQLHAAGYDLALHYRHSADACLQLATQLNTERPSSTLALAAELADIAQLPLLIEQVMSRFGRLDGLINNASAFYPTPIDTATPAQWNELFASNAQAPFFLVQAALPALRQSQGAIINLIDIYAERALREHPLYVMAKAALAAMTRTLAADLGPTVRINGIAPGAVLWPSEGKPLAAQQAMIAATPLQRMGTPDDVARTALWLLRDAPFVTGQIITVDGGRSLP
ncbi:MAG: pteridine reductase, partial [Dyella sp.]